MEVDIDFKTLFFNLEGLHYNERKKNFYKLLNSTSPQVLAQQLDIQPRTYLEKIFHVDILIRSKQIEKLVDILKEGNGVLTSRILKQKWFFEEVFKNMNEDTIVNEFLPTLSSLLRVKVLKKLALALNEERMDNIFDLVLQRYGLSIAQQFLFSCSPAKFISVLKNNQITLSIEQLKRVLDRDSNLVKFYLEEYEKNTGKNFDYNGFLSYLAWKYPQLYFEFVSDYKGSVKLGRYTTKTVLNINKDEALKYDGQIENRFNIAAVTREVKDFHKEHFYKLFPHDMKDIERYHIWKVLKTFLKTYPLKTRWGAFSAAFKKAYSDDLENHLELIDDEVIVIFPTGIKKKWVEIKFRQTNDFKFVKYFEPKQALSLSIEKINVTSNIYLRTEILKDLVRLCHANQDYGTYEEALKYICIRHRNEDAFLRIKLLSDIENHIDYELSTETLWTSINELIDVFRVKGESLPFSNISQYLIFLFHKKLPADNAIVQYIKDIANQDTLEWNFSHVNKQPKIKADVLKHTMKALHTIDPDSERKVLAALLMEEIVDFNETNKGPWVNIAESAVITVYIKDIFDKKQVSDQNDVTFISSLIKNNYSGSAQSCFKVYEDCQFLNIVKTVCANESFKCYKLSKVLLDAVKKPRTTEFQNNLLEYFFTQYFSKHCQNRREAVEYFLTKEPEVLAKYFDQILPFQLDYSILNYDILKLYSHLGLDEKLINYFKPLVSPGSTCESKTTLIQNLSKIMPTDDFINLIKVYIPQKAKFDLMDSDEKGLYEAQCEVAKALKNLDEVTKLIPLLYPLCQGDYLQSSLPLLYKVLYRISEEQARSFIGVLLVRGVSARKHAVYLGFAVLSKKTSLDLFNIIATKEKNVSAKKYLFQGVLKYFLKNPSEYLLEMVLTNMTFIDKNDKELLEASINSVGKVTEKFKPIFAEHLWNVLDNIEKNEVNIVDNRIQFLEAINKLDVSFFRNIKETFCQNIIKDYFLCNDDTILTSGKMPEFVAKYLLAYTNDKQFEFVFNIVKHYKGLHWESDDNDKPKNLFAFFEGVFDGHVDKDIVFWKLFKTYWERVFSPEETFSEYVILSLVIIYKETSNFVDFCAQVNKSFQELVLEYGPYINDLLLQYVQVFLWNAGLNSDVFSKANFALQLLTVDKNDLNCFMASRIMAYSGDNRRSEVINALKYVDNIAVRIRYNDLLKM